VVLNRPARGGSAHRVRHGQKIGGNKAAMTRFARYGFWVACGLLVGCGHTLVSNDQINRDAQNQAAREAHISQLEAELRAVRQEKERSISEAKQKQMEIDRRLEEMTLQLRLIQGKIEKGDLYRGEVEQQVETIATEQAQSVGALRSDLQAQIDSLKAADDALRVSVEAQNSAQVALAGEVSALKENVLPTLADQTARITAAEKQIKKSKGGDSTPADKRLDDLSKTLDGFGRKFATAIDEQKALLRKTTQRLDALERQSGGTP